MDSQGYLKMTDFGLSKMFIKGQKDAHSVCGTPEYIGIQDQKIQSNCLISIKSSRDSGKTRIR